MLYSTTVLGTSVYLILWYFLLYSFLGVVVEALFCLVVEGVLESRSGLLYLPLRPVYGVGGAASGLLLQPLLGQPILIFFFGMLIGTVVEYAGSFILEKGFGTVYWDYSGKPLNLHGRICLEYSVYWGLLALPTLYMLDAFIAEFVDLPGRPVGDVVLTALMMLVLLSAGLTLAALARVRQRVELLKAQAHGEAVVAPTTAINRLIDRLAPDSVMINTFPRLSLMTALQELIGRRRAWLRVPKQFRRLPV